MAKSPPQNWQNQDLGSYMADLTHGMCWYGHLKISKTCVFVLIVLLIWLIFCCFPQQINWLPTDKPVYKPTDKPLTFDYWPTQSTQAYVRRTQKHTASKHMINRVRKHMCWWTCRCWQCVLRVPVLLTHWSWSSMLCSQVHAVCLVIYTGACSASTERFSRHICPTYIYIYI